MLTTFLFQAGFNSEAELAAAYPAGNYTPQLTLTAGGTSSLTVNLGAAPTTPHCANYDAAQAINAAADFTLRWDAFAGATANDRVEIIIFNDQGTEVFRLPDECATPPKPLSATATSVVIPAGTLQTGGRTYAVELGFFKTSDFKNNASPAYTAAGGYFQQTRFNIKTTGGATTGPVITAFRIAADQHFEVDVTATAGQTLTLEATSGYATWTPVGTAVVPASGKATVRDGRIVGSGLQAYRVKAQ